MKDLLERIEKVSFHKDLKDKESDFLTSIKSYFKKNNELTYGQMKYFEAIESRYSPEKLEETRRWNHEYSSFHRESALRMAQYYARNPPYFGKIVQRILADPDGIILTKNQWSKMCENKFAKKILNQYAIAPAYKVGDFLQIRKNNRLDMANYNTTNSFLSKSNKVGVVLGVNALPITRPAKGARIYQVLLVGELAPFYAHESDLKKIRGKKKC